MNIIPYKIIQDFEDWQIKLPQLIITWGVSRLSISRELQCDIKTVNKKLTNQSFTASEMRVIARLVNRDIDYTKKRGRKPVPFFVEKKRKN